MAATSDIFSVSVSTDLFLCNVKNSENCQIKWADSRDGTVGLSITLVWNW